MPAPTDEPVWGMAVLGEDLWISQGDSLYVMNTRTGASRRAGARPGLTNGLAADGKFIYAIDYGWSSGKPIYQIDPATGAIAREIITKANLQFKGSSGFGLEWYDGYLYTFWSEGGSKLSKVDPATGDIVETLPAPPYSRAGEFAHDGRDFIFINDKGLGWMVPGAREFTKQLAMNFPLRAIAFGGGFIYVAEQAVMGFDKHNKPVRIWPRKMAIYKLKA